MVNIDMLNNIFLFHVQYIIIIILRLYLQGKFIRIHFGPSGKIAGADIESCK